MEIKGRHNKSVILGTSERAPAARAGASERVGSDPRLVDAFSHGVSWGSRTALRPAFLERPKAQPINETWLRMTESRGTVFDVRMAGRAIEADLLSELGRYGRDPMDEARVIAELAGGGAIHGHAFQQITNNTNFHGWQRPQEERVAFALAVQRNGGQKLLDSYFNAVVNGQAVDPLAVIHQQTGQTEGFDVWRASQISDAKKIFADAKKGKLFESASYRDIVRAELERTGRLEPGAHPAFSAGGLVAHELARASGASPADAAKAGAQATAKKLDVATLQALAPCAARSGQLYFSVEFPGYASTKAVSFEAASNIAHDVSMGRLGYGQIYGFMLQYGSADEWGTARLSLTSSADMIKAINRGDMTREGMEKALDTRTYFPAPLAKKVWSRMFSASNSKMGNKYTVSGIASESTYTASLTNRLSSDLVVKLANNDQLRGQFAASFQKHLSEALPSRLGMIATRAKNDDSRWEAGAYDGFVDTAFKAARLEAGL